MTLSEQRHDKVLVLRPAGARLDAAGAVAFKDAVAAHIAAGETRLVLDLGGVAFVDSSGLGALVALLKRLGGQGQLVLAAVQPPVQRLLALTRLDRVLAIRETVQQACEAAGA